MPRASRSLLSRGIALLARREHSQAELTRKLAPHAESPEQLEAVLAQLTQAGLQSDSRFAESVVRVRGQGYGLARLRQELSQRGVAEAQSQSALAQACASEAQRFYQVWHKRFQAPPEDLTQRLKQQRFLLSRGFAPGLYRDLERRGFAPPESDSPENPAC